MCFGVLPQPLKPIKVSFTYILFFALMFDPFKEKFECGVDSDAPIFCTLLSRYFKTDFGDILI